MNRASLALFVSRAAGFLLAQAPVAGAQDGAATAVAFFDEGVESLGKKAAAALWKAAESAHKSGLFAYSNAAAKEALEQHFGRSVEETDEAWKGWVRRTH